MRGSVSDAILLPVILFLMLVPFVIAYILNTQIGAAFANIAPSTSHVFDAVEGSLGIFVNAAVFIYFLLMIGAVILAYYSPSHPAFFPLSVLLAAVGTLIAYIMGGMLKGMIVGFGAEGYGPFNFVLGFVVPYLPHLSILTWFLIAIVMYGNIKAYREGI